MNTIDINGIDISDVDLFKDNNDIIDGLEIVNIDIDAISEEAGKKAKILIEDLTKFYYNEEFLKSNPNFRKRVDNDIESLRMLLKMRSADEVTHDILIKAIAANSGNASLYRSLTQVQTTILQITTKIETIVNNLTTLIKGYQLELNFKTEQEQLSDSENTENTEVSVTGPQRGSKAFIEKMIILEQQKETEKENEQE